VGDVAVAPALSHQPARRLERRAQPLEERRVIGDPVEDCAREDHVDGIDAQLQEVLVQHGDGRGQARSRLLDHRGVAVHRYHMGSLLEQQAGDATAAAAGVEHRFVAPDAGALEDLARPGLLRVGEAVVRRGVPAHDWLAALL